MEEKLLALYSEGKMFGTVHTCIGQEFSGAVISEFLQPGDAVFSNHRGHGHFLSITGDATGLIAELMGRTAGVCGGWGGSQHLCKDGFFTNGIQGGIVPVTAGLALARKLSATGKIGLVFIGDGTLGEGAVYETLNIASKWSLPLIVVVEDNGVSQSTDQAETLAGSITARAGAFGISTSNANTWDRQDLWQAAEHAVNSVRKTGRPHFLVVKTFRLKAHSKGDDLRPLAAITAAEHRDPLNELLNSPDSEQAGWIKEIRQRVDDATAEAERSPLPPYAPPMVPPLKPVSWTEVTLTKERVVKLLNQFFTTLMASHSQVVFLGEDIKSPYGGAFKVTQGLSDLHPERVFNTPISEGAIVGIGAGLALAGWRPVVEIMFGDFTSLAFDQILNHAAKFERMYAGQVEVNLIVRTPMGGRRGYGPTHSQTLDRHFLGIPGLRVVALNNLVPP